MKKCTNCGTVNRDDYRFCESCGAPLAENRREEVPRQASGSGLKGNAGGRVYIPNSRSWTDPELSTARQKTKPKWILAIVAGVVLLVLAVVLGTVVMNNDNSAKDVALITGLSEEEVRLLYEQGEAYNNTGDYASAYENFDMISGYRNADSLAKQALENYSEEMSTIIEQNLSDGEYEKAQSLIETARLEVDNNQMFIDLEQRLEASIKEEYITLATEALNTGDYAAAQGYLDDVQMLSDTPDSQVSVLQQEIYDASIQSALDNASSAFLDNKDYNAAISIIIAAIDDYGETAALTEALEEYESYIPVYLTEMETFDWGGYMCSYDEITDNVGNSYENCIGFCLGPYDPWGGPEAFATYYIDGKYTTLTGTCVLKEEFKSTDEEDYFEIYGDSTLIYRSPTMTHGSLPEDFELDVSGYTYLKITFPTARVSHFGTPAVSILCSPMLSK